VYYGCTQTVKGKKNWRKKQQADKWISSLNDAELSFFG
jgi:hypothetical protein